MARETLHRPKAEPFPGIFPAPLLPDSRIGISAKRHGWRSRFMGLSG